MKSINLSNMKIKILESNFKLCFFCQEVFVQLSSLLMQGLDKESTCYFPKISQHLNSNFLIY